MINTKFKKMKKLILAFTVIGTMAVTSCNDNSSHGEDHSKMDPDETMPMDGSKMTNQEVKNSGRHLSPG